MGASSSCNGDRGKDEPDPENSNSVYDQRLYDLITTSASTKKGTDLTDQLAAVQVLINKNADPNHKTVIKEPFREYVGSSCLFKAVRKPEIVKLLLENGALVNIKNGKVSNDTALSAACMDHNVETVKLLLEAKANIKTENFQKKTAWGLIRLTDCRGAADCYQLLLLKGQDINEIAQTTVFADDTRDTALHAHCKKDKTDNLNLSVIKFLLENKADPTIKNKEGKTPLDVVKENTEASGDVVDAIQQATDAWK